MAISVMAMVHLNSCRPVTAALFRQAATLPAGAPVIVMIHGYRYCPANPAHDPHRHILALNPDLPDARRLRSWPAELGLSAEGPEALGIGFGWPARGGLAQVYRRAQAVGRQLADLCDRLAGVAERPVQLIGHSLGARVALQALAAARPGSVGRLILMAAAELRPAAEAALASPAGRLAEIINVTSRENDIFDFLLEIVIARGRQCALGNGLSVPHRNWLDLQIDAPAARAALADLGFPIRGETARACHWSPYLRDGLFDLYRVALTQPWALPLPLLRAHLPAGQARRWSGLFQRPRGHHSSSLSGA